jgi:hypothetical protein
MTLSELPMKPYAVSGCKFEECQQRLLNSFRQGRYAILQAYSSGLWMIAHFYRSNLKEQTGPGLLESGFGVNYK